MFSLEGFEFRFPVYLESDLTENLSLSSRTVELITFCYGMDG